MLPWHFESSGIVCVYKQYAVSRAQYFSFNVFQLAHLFDCDVKVQREKMFEQMKNIRKFDFPLDRYDNDPFLKNPLLKYRQSKNKAKRNDKQQAKLVSLFIKFI